MYVLNTEPDKTYLKSYELKFDFVKEYGSNMKLLSRFEVRKIISILRICLMLNHGKGNDISS